MQTTINPVMTAADWRQQLRTNRGKTLEKMYARTYLMVGHYVKQHNGTDEDAQDLLQEAIIVFYEKLMHEEFTLTVPASTYLMGICKNLWRQELEKRRRQTSVLPAETEVAAADSVTNPEQPAMLLTSLVAQLGQKCESILLGFYYFGQSMSSLAEQHQYRTVRSVTVQKYKCLERLRKSLAGYTVQHFR